MTKETNYLFCVLESGGGEKKNEKGISMAHVCNNGFLDLYIESESHPQSLLFFIYN